MSNPRFPHSCIIRRIEGDIQDGVTNTILLYNGSCRKELNKFNNQNNSNSANTSQWILSLPLEVMVKFGDSVIVNDGISEMGGVVSDWEVTNITHCNTEGVYQKDVNNNITSLDGTITKGMHIYVDVVKN